MDYEENMIDNVEADEALPEDIVEAQDESEQSVDQFIEDAEEAEQTEQQTAAEQQKPQQQGTGEPGYIKQRINKAVEKAVAETEARMRDLFEQQMKPIRDKMMESEAQELVRNRKVADIETARELVRLRNNMPAQEAPQQQEAQKPQQPRNERGQFAPKEDPATTAKIQMLQHQADRIKNSGGPDVIAEFTNNPEIKKKVIAGEMDFYEVAEYMRSPNRRRPPAPTRSPNGANSFQPNSIESMSDAAFARMDRMIDEGVRFTRKR